MRLFESLKKRYTKDNKRAAEAQRLAHEIAQGPVVFQTQRLMVKWGIFALLEESGKTGLTEAEIAERTHLSGYAVKILLESSLTAGTVWADGDRYKLAKAGWFLQNDRLVRVNMAFNHDVNYNGLFYLEDALREGRPSGLKVFGDWPTIYEGLSRLPEKVQESWFGFDHFYSDCSFDEALDIIGKRKPKTLLDIGGNTGRFALRCVEKLPDIEVTIMDLPGQLGLMREAVKGKNGADRIHGHGGNLLDPKTEIPTGFDVIWMSQFLDCFAPEEIESILGRAARSMDGNARLYIMETFWDRQKYETAAYCLTQTSVYFTALANGNSKMYHADEMANIVKRAGLNVEEIHDGLGMGHSIMVCRK